MLSIDIVPLDQLDTLREFVQYVFLKRYDKLVSWEGDPDETRLALRLQTFGLTIA
jgi:hypothetical protein